MGWGAEGRFGPELLARGRCSRFNGRWFSWLSQHGIASLQLATQAAGSLTPIKIYGNRVRHPWLPEKTRALPQPRDYEPSEEKCCGWLPTLGKPPRQAPRNGESKPENVAQQQQQALSSSPELLSELSLFHLFGTRNHQSQFQVKSSPVTQLVPIPQRD